jgi:2-polyprenyl-3-methyl-5-hydroxy-6-metoxy-1,4-benzoquinol methylase
MKNKKCLICESTNLTPLRGYEIHDLIKCKKCDFIFMNKIPTDTELQEHYSTYSYTEDQSINPLTLESYNELLDHFEKYRKSNNIIDIGCGQGWFLEAAKQKGWNVFGTEYSKKAIELCIKKGLNMKEGVINPLHYKNIEFDVVFSSEVLEHINNPISELSIIYNLLRKGGLLYLTTPNFNCYLRYQLKDKYDIISYPEHLSYYTNKTLNKVLSQTGFKKKKLLTTGISITRFERSKGIRTESIDHISKDEKLRKLMSSNLIMKNAKKIANRLLTIFGLGMTLKAYYEK